MLPINNSASHSCQGIQHPHHRRVKTLLHLMKLSVPTLKAFRKFLHPFNLSGASAERLQCQVWDRF